MPVRSSARCNSARKVRSYSLAVVINVLSQPQHQNGAQQYCDSSFLVANANSRSAAGLRQLIVVKYTILYVHVVAVKYTG
jgi:hypothetical protein